MKRARQGGAGAGRSPHDFVGQEAAVVAGIARFVRGGRYRCAFTGSAPGAQ